MSVFQVALTVHLLAISVWLGGMVLLAALVPALRRAAPDEATARKVVTASAQRFNVVAWSAFGVAVFAGIWMLLQRPGLANGRLVLKLVFVALSALAAAVHAFWVGPRIRRVADIDPGRATRLRRLSGILGGLAVLFAACAVAFAVRLASA